MENREKSEVVEGKDTSNSWASRDGNLPQEGLPSGDGEATGSRSQLSWETEVGSPDTLAATSPHPSISPRSVSSFILSVQPYYHKPVLVWETGTTFLHNHPADSSATLQEAGKQQSPALPTMIMPRHKLFFTSLGLQRDHNPWHYDEMPFFWTSHQLPTPRSFKKGLTLPRVLPASSGGQFSFPSCSATTGASGLPPSPLHHSIALHVLCQRTPPPPRDHAQPSSLCFPKQKENLLSFITFIPSQWMWGARVPRGCAYISSSP